MRFDFQLQHSLTLKWYISTRAFLVTTWAWKEDSQLAELTGYFCSAVSICHTSLECGGGCIAVPVFWPWKFRWRKMWDVATVPSRTPHTKPWTARAGDRGPCDLGEILTWQLATKVLPSSIIKITTANIFSQEHWLRGWVQEGRGKNSSWSKPGLCPALT